MEEEDNIIVKWAQEDVETSYNLLNNNTKTINIFGKVNILRLDLSNFIIFPCNTMNFRIKYSRLVNTNAD